MSRRYESFPCGTPGCVKPWGHTDLCFEVTTPRRSNPESVEKRDEESSDGGSKHKNKKAKADDSSPPPLSEKGSEGGEGIEGIEGVEVVPAVVVNEDGDSDTRRIHSLTFSLPTPSPSLLTPPAGTRHASKSGDMPRPRLGKVVFKNMGLLLLRSGLIVRMEGRTFDPDVVQASRHPSRLPLSSSPSSSSPSPLAACRGARGERNQKDRLLPSLFPYLPNLPKPSQVRAFDDLVSVFAPRSTLHTVSLKQINKEGSCSLDEAIARADVLYPKMKSALSYEGGSYVKAARKESSWTTAAIARGISAGGK